jgi:MFS family permease
MPNIIFNSTRFNLMFRALKHKNYRLFVSGQSLSLIGTWIQQVAMTWLVYRITGSAFMLGVLGFSGQLPLFIIASFAGVLADRWDRHKMLLYTQSLALVQALILSILVFTEIVHIWQLIFLAVLLGTINAFDMPIRQAFVSDMIENKKEDLGNAVALNSSMVNAARLVGPSIAGLLIATAGEGWCFLINGVSYLAVVISLLKMEINYIPKGAKESKIIKELKEGFSYTFGFPPIMYLILLLATVSLMSNSLTLLAPVFAKEYLNGNASTFGFLMAGYGSGALAGAVYLLNKKNVLGLGRLIGYAVIILSISMFIMAFSRVFILSIIVMFIAGTGTMLHIASVNTLLQTISEESKRGRVMSFYAMAFRGMSPFGSIIGGGLGGWIGAPLTIIIGGAASLSSALFYISKLSVIRPLVKPIYENLGILPQVARGVQQATDNEAKAK